MKLIAQNRKARFDYTLIAEKEAGIVLLGSEVKSLRQKGANIADAFARFINGELFLLNAHISVYKESSYFNHDPKRMRKLLMHAKELTRLKSKAQERGMALIPTQIYFTPNNKVKVTIALAQGKRQFDKRQALKEREVKLNMDRAIKQNNRVKY